MFHYFISKAKKENPTWYMVDVKYERMTKRYIPLHELKELHLKHKASGGPLRDLALFTKARLSVMPITEGWLLQIVEIHSKHCCKK